MNSSIHIANHYLIHYETRTARMPRKRFITYYHDLYARQNKSLLDETFLTGSQYSYVELGKGVLTKYAYDDLIKEIDLLIIVAWAHEFDPDYCSTGAYFTHQFQFKGKIFDIGDQGALGFFTALDVAKKYLQNSPARHALLLMMEQTSIPGAVHACQLPTQNASFGLMISSNKENQENHHQILSSGIRSNAGLDQFIMEQCAYHHISYHTLNVIVKNNSSLQLALKNIHRDFPGMQTTAIANLPGNFPLFSYLQDLTETKQSWILMLDEDVETTDIGYVLLRRSL